MTDRSWTDLLVQSDSDAPPHPITDPDVLRDTDLTILPDGSLGVWQGTFVAWPEEFDDADGNPDYPLWECPQGAVDWTGFREVVESLRGLSDDEIADMSPNDLLKWKHHPHESHQWRTTDDESRSYCMLCGADGDA